VKHYLCYDLQTTYNGDNLQNILEIMDLTIKNEYLQYENKQN